MKTFTSNLARNTVIKTCVQIVNMHQLNKALSSVDTVQLSSKNKRIFAQIVNTLQPKKETLSVDTVKPF